MTTSGPGGYEYPPLGDRDGPVEYPADAGPPPPGYPMAGPAYYPSYDPYQPVRPTGTNGKAIASLVCSAVGLMCCGLTSIVGVILGVIAMRETRRSGQDGHGLALAGTIIGGLAIAAWAVYMLIYVVLLTSGWSLV
jgi:hypothetical protein